MTDSSSDEKIDPKYMADMYTRTIYYSKDCFADYYQSVEMKLSLMECFFQLCTSLTKKMLASCNLYRRRTQIKI